MKKLYWITIILILLTFAVTGVFFAFLPNLIPMHYNFQGIVDRFGSKYEMIVLPIIAAVCTVPLLPLAKVMGKKYGNGTEKAILITAILTAVIFAVIHVWLLWKAYTYRGAEEITRPVDFYKITVILMGVMLVFLSNLMPKAPMNALFGLRTPWSTENERVWQKCQRFGGYSGILCGILVLLAGIFFEQITAELILLALLLVWVVCSTAASYFICKADRNDHTGEK